MVRRKLPPQRIEKDTARKNSFSNRQKGLFKKAQDLSVLCDAQVASIVFSEGGDLFEYGNPSVAEIIDKWNARKANPILDPENVEGPIDAPADVEGLIEPQGDMEVPVQVQGDIQPVPDGPIEPQGNMEEPVQAEGDIQPVLDVNEKYELLIEENKHLKLEMSRMEGSNFDGLSLEDLMLLKKRLRASLILLEEKEGQLEWELPAKINAEQQQTVDNISSELQQTKAGVQNVNDEQRVSLPDSATPANQEEGL